MTQTETFFTDDQRLKLEAAIARVRETGEHEIVDLGEDLGGVVVGPTTDVRACELVIAYGRSQRVPYSPWLLDLLWGWSQYIDSHDEARRSHADDYVAYVLDLYHEASTRLDALNTNQTTLAVELLFRFINEMGYRTDLELDGDGGESTDRRLLRRLHQELLFSASGRPSKELMDTVAEWLDEGGDDLTPRQETAEALRDHPDLLDRVAALRARQEGQPVTAAQPSRLLVRYQEDFGRMGDLDALFVTDAATLERLKAKGEVYLGEVLGKHSEVIADLNDATLTVLSDDPTFLAQFTAVMGEGTISGVDLLGGLEDEDE